MSSKLKKNCGPHYSDFEQSFFSNYGEKGGKKSSFSALQLSSCERRPSVHFMQTQMFNIVQGICAKNWTKKEVWTFPQEFPESSGFGKQKQLLPLQALFFQELKSLAIF